MEKGIFNSTFFNFLFGFIFILSMSLGVVIVVNFYDISTDDLVQAAGTLFFFQ